MKHDPSNPLLLQALADMTCLRNLTHEEKSALKTQEDVWRFERETGRMSEYNDLWGIARAAYAILREDPACTIIGPSDLIPRLQPTLQGDKRSKRYQRACERQMERMTSVLTDCMIEIFIAGPDIFVLQPRRDMGDRLERLQRKLIVSRDELACDIAAQVIKAGDEAIARLRVDFTRAVESRDDEEAEALAQVLGIVDSLKLH